jgi:hypothetical protein
LAPNNFHPKGLKSPNYSSDADQGAAQPKLQRIGPLDGKQRG